MKCKVGNKVGSELLFWEKVWWLTKRAIQLEYYYVSFISL